MTAVVAILNKRGLAIAADSAVTRSRMNGDKITKNGNKMVRLSNAVPISVMFTGNGAFLGTTWDILARQYRLRRGDIPHETVEACVHDFFKYIADNHLFCDKKLAKRFVRSEIGEIYGPITESINCDIESYEEQVDASESITQDFLEMLQQLRNSYIEAGICPHFKDYTPAQFHEFAGELVSDYLKNCVAEEDDFYFDNECFPKDVINAIHEELELTLLARLSTNRYGEPFTAKLVFTGFGAKQDYPSLVAATVFEGFDDRANYYFDKKNVVNISDACPVAICPFAQDDVVESLLRGMHEEYFNKLKSEVHDSINPFFSNILDIQSLDPPTEDEDSLFDDRQDSAWNLFHDISSSDLVGRYESSCRRHMDANRRKWEKALMNYDLPSMAALAESLIDLTGFQRIITFSNEGVGGPVDLAVVTKTDGFVWLNRKSWYHHKDIGGKYGKFGV